MDAGLIQGFRDLARECGMEPLTFLLMTVFLVPVVVRVVFPDGGTGLRHAVESWAGHKKVSTIPQQVDTVAVERKSVRVSREGVTATHQPSPVLVWH